MKRIHLRKLVTYTLMLSMMLTLLTFVQPVNKAAAVTPSQSTFFSYADIEECSTYNVTSSDGDLWPTAWGDDDYLYTANGDGKGFGTVFSDINVNKMSGDPYNRNITGSALTSNISQVWTSESGDSWNRKPTGMICVDGILYCAVQDLNCNGTNAFNDAPAATICKSTDKGLTWTWDTTKPMFSNYIFTTIMFLDYGKNNQYGTDGYVYAYGLDYNWRDSFNNRVTDPTKMYLARVPKESIMNRSTWEFYTGDLNGNATWSSDISLKQPVLQDDTRLYSNTCFAPGRSGDPSNFTIPSQGSVVYNQPLNRYIYSAWTEYTFEFYESPTPYGPWKKFLSKDYGAYIWESYKNGGYSTTIPSKFISSDGMTMWVQSNTFMGAATNYCYSLRKLVVKPYQETTPTNTKSTNNLAMASVVGDVIPISTCFHYGKKNYLNDGVTNVSEDSWNGVVKTSDYWGYLYTKAYNMNKVVYTSGTIFSDGGWFSSLKVQVRQNHTWVDVTGLSVSPVYPNSSSAGANTSYTFTFDDTWGDGIRIYGTPGGTAHFTSISELAVYYTSVNSNLVTDGNFELQTSRTSLAAPWFFEGTATDRGVDLNLGFGFTGNNNAFIRTSTNNSWNAIVQPITVTANTYYRLTGYIQNSNNLSNVAYFGVRNSNSTVNSEVNFGGLPGYTQITVDFNSGSNTTMYVFAGWWSNGSDVWMRFDDFTVRQR